jgi:hypothetical protein
MAKITPVTSVVSLELKKLLIITYATITTIKWVLFHKIDILMTALNVTADWLPCVQQNAA